MPKVSIIMPTYNRAWIIERAIESVLKQTFIDFELLVIDDGSTDDTRKLIKKQTDSRIKLFASNHRGASAARNIGLSQARGEFIAYLDTDNVWHPNFLEVMAQEFGSDDVLLYSGQNLLYAKRNAEDTLDILARRTRTIPFNPAKLMHENFIDINIVMHRRDLLDTVGHSTKI